MTARRRLSHRKQNRVRQGAAPAPTAPHNPTQPEAQPTRGVSVPAKNDKTRPTIYMRPHIRRAFETHPGKVLWVSDLKNAIRDGNPKAGDGTGILTSSVQNAIRTLISEGAPIEMVSPGQAWKYMPQTGDTTEASPAEAKPVSAPPAPKTLFELLAVRRDGSYLLEDENGQLFSATPLHP